MTQKHIKRIVLGLQAQNKTIKKTPRTTYLLNAAKRELTVLRRSRVPSGVILDTQNSYSY